MFPASYFPDPYFTGGYFPHRGAAGTTSLRLEAQGRTAVAAAWGSAVPLTSLEWRGRTGLEVGWVSESPLETLEWRGRTALEVSRVSAASLSLLSWGGRTCLEFSWDTPRTRIGRLEVIELDRPARKDTPLRITFTFLDYPGEGTVPVAIDLTPYTAVRMDAKKQGLAMVSSTAEFVWPRADGVVRLASFPFPQAGDWIIQFVATDGDGVELNGEPIKLAVAKNVDDMALDEDTLPA